MVAGGGSVEWASPTQERKKKKKKKEKKKEKNRKERKKERKEKEKERGCDGRGVNEGEGRCLPHVEGSRWSRLREKEKEGKKERKKRLKIIIL